MRLENSRGSQGLRRCSGGLLAAVLLLRGIHQQSAPAEGMEIMSQERHRAPNLHRRHLQRPALAEIKWERVQSRSPLLQQDHWGLFGSPWGPQSVLAGRTGPPGRPQGEALSPAPTPPGALRGSPRLSAAPSRQLFRSGGFLLPRYGFGFNNS